MFARRDENGVGMLQRQQVSWRDRRCRTERVCVKSKAQLSLDTREDKQEENSVEWPTFRGVYDEGQKPG